MFFDFFGGAAIGSFEDFRTFNVKAFFFFLKEIHNFGSQGCTGLGRSAVVYILLYGLFIFLLCKSAARFFFSRCQFGFILFFFFLSLNISVVVVLSIGGQRIVFPPFGA